MEKYPSKFEFYAPVNSLGCDQIHASLQEPNLFQQIVSATWFVACPSPIPKLGGDGLPANRPRLSFGPIRSSLRVLNCRRYFFRMFALKSHGVYWCGRMIRKGSDRAGNRGLPLRLLLLPQVC